MNLLVEGGQPQQNNLLKAIALGVIASLFMVIAALLWSGTINSQEMASEEQISEDEPAALEGSIFMSLGVISTTTGNRDFVSTVLDASSGKLSSMPVSSLKGEEVITLRYNVSPETQYATFLGLQLNDFTLNSGKFDSWNVYRTHLRGLPDGQSFYQTVEVVSEGFAGDADDYYRESPVISTEGTMLYSSLAEEEYLSSSSTLAALSAQSWNIYSIASDNSKRLLTTGLSPKWIDQSMFAFLKNDGVYMFDLKTNTEFKVYETPSLTIVNGFDVSNDGSHFVITDPEVPEVRIFEVSDWFAGILVPVAVIPVAATNPVFSPGNQNLAMIVLRPSENGDTEPIVQLEYFSLQAQDFLTEKAEIGNETVDGVYLTDWQ